MQGCSMHELDNSCSFLSFGRTPVQTLVFVAPGSLCPTVGISLDLLQQLHREKKGYLLSNCETLYVPLTKG